MQQHINKARSLTALSGRSALETLGFLAVGAASGYIGWTQEGFAWLTLVMPAAWVFSRNRIECGANALGYYLGATWYVNDAIHGFFDDISNGTVLSMWIAAGIFMSIAWLIFKTPSPIKHIDGNKQLRNEIAWRSLTLILSASIATLPPFALIGWVHPLYGAADLLPDSGWFGVIFCVLTSAVLGTVFSLPYKNPKKHKGAAAIATLIVLVGILGWHLNATRGNTRPPADWIALDTNFGKAPSNIRERIARHSDLLYKVMGAQQSGKHVLIFPELAAGFWPAGTELGYQWLITPDTILFIGGETRTSPHTLKNSLIAITKEAANADLIVSRQSVPVTMWNPLSPQEHVPSDWFRLNSIRLPSMDGSKKASFLLCWEEMNALAGFSAMLSSPDVLIVASNVWWAKTPESERAQDIHSRLLAKLFGIPRLKAKNY